MNVTIDNAPELIKDSELKILEVKNKICSIKEQITNISRATAGEVASETTGGKKVFGNATERELETEKRLLQNDRYQSLKTALIAEENRKAEEEINLQYIRDAFSSQRYKMRLACASRAENASDKFVNGMQMLVGIEPILKSLLLTKGATIDTPANNVPVNCPF